MNNQELLKKIRLNLADAFIVDDVISRKKVVEILNNIEQEINSETSHNSRKNQSALDYILKYEITYPAISGTKELIHFTEWLLKQSKAD